MLASFFYGYIVTQIAGGWLSRRYGGRRVIGYGMALCILSTLLMPVCARAHVALVFVLRIIAGLSTVSNSSLTTEGKILVLAEEVVNHFKI